MKTPKPKRFRRREMNALALERHGNTTRARAELIEAKRREALSREQVCGLQPLAIARSRERGHLARQSLLQASFKIFRLRSSLSRKLKFFALRAQGGQDARAPG
jgi:hypothetical protein